MSTEHRALSTMFAALRAAGKLIRDAADGPQKIKFKNKSRINLVTAVDTAADRLIRRMIGRAFPAHDFLTEESEPTGRGSAYKWIIDPLDGTTNYAHHFPQVGVSIALEYTPPHPGYAALSRRERAPQGGVRRSIIVLGGVYDPFRDELFWAARGKGAWMIHGNRTRRIEVSRTPTLTRSLLLTGFPYDRKQRIDLYLSYVKAFMGYIQGIRRSGAAALDLCWVACGRVDGFWEWRLKPWDVAAGMIILEEAGGRLTNFAGKRFSIYGEQTLATNGRIHTTMLRVMRRLKT